MSERKGDHDQTMYVLIIIYPSFVYLFCFDEFFCDHQKHDKTSWDSHILNANSITKIKRSAELVKRADENYNLRRRVGQILITLIMTLTGEIFDFSGNDCYISCLNSSLEFLVMDSV